MPAGFPRFYGLHDRPLWGGSLFFVVFPLGVVFTGAGFAERAPPDFSLPGFAVAFAHVSVPPLLEFYGTITY
jgi:hypothetical protein